MPIMWFNESIDKITELKQLQTICITWAMLWGFRSVGIWCCNGLHPIRLEYFKLLFYIMQSFSMSLQITFHSETLTTTTLESFSPVCCLTCLFKFMCPVNAFPQTEHTKHFSPDCTITWHKKYPLSVKGSWHVAHVYRNSTVWILNEG
jgi:hypothetical protein